MADGDDYGTRPDLGLTSQSKVKEFFNLHPNGVICHAVSPDGTLLAASIKGENLVEIYKIGDHSYPNRWELAYQLTEHNDRIAAIDWSKKNQILTCSYDRNIFVWKLDEKAKKWRPELVLIKQRRAVLCGCWDPSGNKFVAGTGTHQVFVGCYESKYEWWQALPAIDTKKFPGFKSSVLCVAFHPSGRVIAAGSSDNTVKIITAYIKEVDGNQPAGGTVFADVTTFGTVLHNVDLDAWVEAIAFSPSGAYLSVAGKFSPNPPIASPQLNNS
eukprot:TRINITY_DN3756_c0_g1_i1.p1 TRINITY_DN3756_c0_g1~~TRINITY_DN3756_c0_g1_i1.p1  ORF type:complete len:271 (-),score=44.27 TRINITY_DN3756_c0_g1_i1:427-1239(-)